MYGVESHTLSFLLWVRCDGRTVLKGFAEGFVYHSVSHQFHIGKVPAYILDNLQIVVTAIFLPVIKRLYRDTVLVLEQGVQESPVGVSARMPHDVDLVGCRLDKGQHVAIVLGLEVSYRFDIPQMPVVVEFDDISVVVVEPVAIAEDDALRVV